VLHIKDDLRGSGKTTKTINLLRTEEYTYALVPNFHIREKIYPEDVREKVFTYLDLDGIFRQHEIKKLVIDEYWMSDKFKIAELFYYLGQYHIDVIIYGGASNEEKIK